MRLVVLGICPSQAGDALWHSATGKRIARLSGVELGTWAGATVHVNLTDELCGVRSRRAYQRSRWWRAAYRGCEGASVLALGRRTWEYLSGISHRSGWLYSPFSMPAESVLVIPHPSGRDRSYNFADVRREVGRQLRVYIDQRKEA